MMSTLASMEGYSVDIGLIPPEEEAFAVGSIAMDDSGGDEYVRCHRCGYGGCDIRVATCGCTAHAVRQMCTAWYSHRNIIRWVGPSDIRSHELMWRLWVCVVSVCSFVGWLIGFSSLLACRL
jgi:hypothetical protein